MDEMLFLVDKINLVFKVSLHGCASKYGVEPSTKKIGMSSGNGY